MKTPVALIIFNRPSTTAKVFEAIRQAKPPKLLVVADGARSDRPEEAEKCLAARAIIEGVDWECEVLTNYSDVNLGCKQRLSSGLDWVFANVEEAIILEDDCLPDPSFFPFCEQLLEHYRHDQRIMVISGVNFQFGNKRTNDSYYFSRYMHCWGWASWRRAWQYYDVEMKLWPKIRDENWLQSVFAEASSINYWQKILQATYQGEINTWDYQWTFACWLQNGLTVLPNVNLISNIGFGVGSTHTEQAENLYANLPVEQMSFPLSHPQFIIRDTQADSFTQNEHFGLNFGRRLLNKTQKIFNQLVKS